MTDLATKYRADWSLFIREVLGVRVLTDDQLTLIRTVQKYPRVLGMSGHGTGKTFIAGAMALSFLSLYKNSIVIVTSSSQLQVTTKLWAEVRTLHKGAKIPLGGELTATRLVINDKWYALATATNDPSNLQGGHAEHILLVADEGQAVVPEIFGAFEGMMGSVDPHMLILFNPLFAGGFVHEASRKTDQWKLCRLSCLTHPNVLTGTQVIPGAVTREWVEDRKRVWGETSPLYVSKVLGEFPETTEDTLISLLDLERSALLAAPLPGDGTWLGVDIARFGSDMDDGCVVHDGRVIAEETWQGLDLMRTCGKIHEIVRDYDIPWNHVNIDGAGVGGGVVDRLREQGFEVNDVQYGGGPVGDWDSSRWADRMGCAGTLYTNRKAELHWVVRNLLKNKMLSVPKRFERIWADLLAPKYKTGSDGSIKVESKDELRKRIKRSPDAGDGLVLAMSRDCIASADSIVQFA